MRRGSDRRRLASFESADAIGERRQAELGVGPGQSYQRDLERDARIRRVLDADEGFAEHLERTSRTGRREQVGLSSYLVALAVGQTVERVADRGKEHVAEPTDQFFAEHARAASAADRPIHRKQRLAGVAFTQRLDEIIERLGVLGQAARRRDLIERGLHVARRTTARPHHVLDRALGDVEPGVFDDVLGQRSELVGRQQVQLEMLAATADGGQHLLGIGGGQHEDHVRRRFLERLQQRVRRRRGEHVDLVEDVHLGATGRAERGLVHEIADVFDLVVRRRVHLVDVEARALFDRQAGVALAVGFTVDGVLTVEDLGEDARRGCLARAARSAQQIGVAHAVFAHRVLQRPNEVVLASHLGEALRSIAPVERLVGHGRTLPVTPGRGACPHPTNWQVNSAPGRALCQPEPEAGLGREGARSPM